MSCSSAAKRNSFNSALLFSASSPEAKEEQGRNGEHKYFGAVACDLANTEQRVYPDWVLLDEQ